MTDTIEPPEEQREAAAIHTFGLHCRRPDVIAWVRTGQASGLSDIIVGVELEQARYLARTFAEREAKAVAEATRIMTLNVVVPTMKQRDAAHARIAELESQCNDLTAQNNRLHAANAVLARERSEAVLGTRAIQNED